MTPLADRWLAYDRERARDRTEADALMSSAAVRACIVERWNEDRDSADTLSAFAQLGRVLAAEAVSCATALATVSSFGSLLPDSSVESLDAARSALADAFLDAQLERERREHRVRFEECWIVLSPGLGAVSASPPCDDLEWLQEWADGVTRALLRRKVRLCHVRAPEPARAALAAALELVGIVIADVSDTSPTAPSAPPAASGTRPGWRRLLGF